MSQYEFINDHALRQWTIEATPQDIELALQVGWRNVQYMKLRTVETRVFRTNNLPDPISDLPVARGQVGEEFVECILQRRFGEITNVTKTPKSGDLGMWFQNRKLMIEVKNYSNPVPSHNVDKFRRDLSVTGVSCAVFISLRTAISGITDDFRILLETIDGRVIPCAYIVSDNEHMIITAVNIVLQLVTSLSFIKHEVYARDVVLARVKDITEHIDELANARNTWQKDLTDSIAKLMKSSSAVLVPEAKIRASVDAILSELFHTVNLSIDQAVVDLSAVPSFAKLKPAQQSQVHMLMTTVQKSIHRDDLNGSVWKVTKQKCANTTCGIAIIFLAKRLQIQFPRMSISGEKILELMTRFGDKFEISDGILIDIEDSSIDVIIGLINGLSSQ